MSGFYNENVNTRTTPLHIASVSGKLGLCKMILTKGQFISKEPSVAEDSPKKRTNEFVFFYQTAFCVVKRRLSAKSEFVCSFFGRNHKTF